VTEKALSETMNRGVEFSGGGISDLPEMGLGAGARPERMTGEAEPAGRASGGLAPCGSVFPT
jgi:hypothetical protein